MATSAPLISPLTAAERKSLASLATSKGRRELGMFMAQGTKCVLDTLGHFPLCRLLATSAWVEEHGLQQQVTVVKRADIERITTLTTAPDVIAVYELTAPQAPDLSGLVLALDRIQDPGNLGTIMRAADWMGVRQIIATTDTVDCFSPKAVQATMGAISRVRVSYVNLPEALSAHGNVYGTFLDGENLYTSPLPNPDRCIIVLGNEGSGISDEVAAAVDHRITIPAFPAGAETSESLNVGVAAAITMAEFRRRIISQ